MTPDTPECKVCGTPVQRRRNVTCSVRCARVWQGRTRAAIEAATWARQTLALCWRPAVRVEWW